MSASAAPDASEPAVGRRFRVRGSGGEVLSVASYAVLGSILVWTRFVGLDRSFWHDEIVTVTYYVRSGPREILTGFYIPNNHELFSLLGWVTSSVAGESELALRLWSVVPFILGAIVVTAWLHVRVGPLSGLLFLFFTTMSPLLLDVSRQARGYGLAFLAMSVLVVAALEADRSGRNAAIAAFVAAGLVGTWTLPVFGPAFLATGAVLLTNVHLRRRVAVGSGAATLAICAWYAPHLDDLLASSNQNFGAPIPWFGIVTAPIEQVVAPALLGMEGVILTTDPTRLPLVAALAFMVIASPLLREIRPAFILSSGFAATLLIVWATRTYLEPRFVSYLLVPLFILLASGAARLLARSSRRPGVGAVLTLAVSALVVVTFVGALKVTRIPREAHRDAAETILQRASPTVPILAYTYRPTDLEFYLGKHVRALEHSEVASSVCGIGPAVVYVTQPFLTRPLTLPCLHGAGVTHYRFEQYSRGEEINVWFLPSARSSGERSPASRP